jgi:hypothetical protein
MIDLHLLACADVELLLDQLFGDMPRQGRVTFERRDGLQRPSLVGVVVSVGAAQREGGHLVEEEVQAVIVVDDDGDVGLVVPQPCFGGLVTVEEPFPVRFLCQPVGNGVAHGWYVRAGDAAADPSQSSTLRAL